MTQETYVVTVTNNESPTVTKPPIIDRFKKLIESDPKPIFDNFRNMAIVIAIGLGGGYLKTIEYPKDADFSDALTIFTNVVFGVIVATTVFLFFINIKHAHLSLNKFFIGYVFVNCCNTVYNYS